MKKKTSNTGFILKATLLTAIVMYFITTAAIESGIWTLSWSSFFEFLIALAACFYFMAIGVSMYEHS